MTGPRLACQAARLLPQSGPRGGGARAHRRQPPRGQCPHRRRLTQHAALRRRRWRQILLAANCRVEVCTSPDTILSNATIKALIGSKCDGVIGQLTEASAPLGEGRAPALLLLAPAAATAGCTCQPSRPRLAASAAHHA